MCGIWALFGCDCSDLVRCKEALKVAHRGPDSFQINNLEGLKNSMVAFHRLHVVGGIGGMQPMILKKYPHLSLLCNGEIYNYKTLQKEFDYLFQTDCDCEIILHLYNEFGGKKASQLLDGVFAFIVIDTKQNCVMLSRDSYGVRPLYYVTTKAGVLGACSEVKVENILLLRTLTILLLRIRHFPPGHYMFCDIMKNGKVIPSTPTKFHRIDEPPAHLQYQRLELENGLEEETVKRNIRYLFSRAVDKRLMGSRRVGSLLSGGLDSSVVAALTAQKLKEHGVAEPLQTFTIGMNSDSTDVIAARKVARHIGSEHHEITFTLEEGMKAVKSVIFTLETYDVLAIRPSVPMYILCQHISRNTNNILIMTGEGADEVAQGYLHFLEQPTPEDGHKESMRQLQQIYMYDVLRIDRCTAAHGLEIRAPFLDHAFTSYYLNLPADMRAPKNGIEKYFLRAAFAGANLIPNNTLWRKKEGFSTGVGEEGTSWFEHLQQHLEGLVKKYRFARASQSYTHNTPRTKEELFYRQIFEKKFGSKLDRICTYQRRPKWAQA
uniref:Asparagine synthetase [glutamine-hydrolyzing] n=1 Tax=Ciona savignyi TaxID=51511 RepID=H2Y466_CIOSA